VKTLSGKQFTKILEKQGWSLMRTHGSHFIYGKEGSINRLSVPVHGNKPLKKGLLRHLMKMAKLDESDLK
jgi:predicted RNA binding protein YcfA (HicA-like mRNA interferase family)